MFKMFLEIAFEAEVDTEEHPELLELAEKLCNEHQDTRAAAIQELRDMIYERGECAPRRTDDQFLLRFLRQRRFIVRHAHRQLVRYCNFLDQFPKMYRDVDLWDLARLGPTYEGCMLDPPGVGRVSILRFGAWDPDELSGEFLVQVGFATMEIALRTPKMQILGSTFIIDMENITLKHIATLTPTLAYQFVSILGLAVPVPIHAIHFVNYNWLFHTFFFIFKRFIPKKAWKFMHFHGQDLKSMQQHFKPEYLPPRYGGSSRHYTTIGNWFNKIKKYRDEAFDKEMKECGWLIKE